MDAAGCDSGDKYAFIISYSDTIDQRTNITVEGQNLKHTVMGFTLLHLKPDTEYNISVQLTSAENNQQIISTLRTVLKTKGEKTINDIIAT